MNTRWITSVLLAGMAALGLSACLRPIAPKVTILEPMATITPLPYQATHRPPIAAATHEPPIAVATLEIFPTATPIPTQPQPTFTPLPTLPQLTYIPAFERDGVMDIPITLGATPQKLALAPCAQEGAYLVEIIPGNNAPDGAYVETSILPESDGQAWYDVLTYAAPAINPAIDAVARVRWITGWRVVERFSLTLTGGEWRGFVISPEALGNAYLVEVNPLEPGAAGDRVQEARILPEYTEGKWQDVLRIREARRQGPLPVEVVVYAAPISLSVDSYDLVLKAGDWPGYGVDYTISQAAYLIGVKPISMSQATLDKAVVEQEFNGSDWNSVVRLRLADYSEALNLRVRIYQVP